MVEDWVSNELDLYISLKVKEYLGLSYTEFLDLPKIYKQVLLDKLETLVTAENDTLNELKESQELATEAANG